MNSFRIIGDEQELGDETKKYLISISPTATVKEVVEDILSRKDKWGFIGIKDKKEPFHGAHSFEYRYGINEKIPAEEELFWREIMNCRVLNIEGSGGWSRDDFQFVIEKESRIDSFEALWKKVNMAQFELIATGLVHQGYYVQIELSLNTYRQLLRTASDFEIGTKISSVKNGGTIHGVPFITTLDTDRVLIVKEFH